jgi:hypothetical protein
MFYIYVYNFNMSRLLTQAKVELKYKVRCIVYFSKDGAGRVNARATVAEDHSQNMATVR